MKKFVISFLLASLMIVSFAPVAFGQGTVMPTTDKLLGGVEDTKDKDTCIGFMKKVNESLEPEKDFKDNIGDVLGCAIKTGRIELWMIPYYVLYIIEWLLGLAGLIAVVFVVIGGYQYIIGGLTEERDKAKKTIMYAIGGFVLALLSWAIVNLIQMALTS
ncbi:MAG: pilin [Patescibacteria group bacterium]